MKKKSLLLLLSLSVLVLSGVACSDEVIVTEEPLSPWVSPASVQVNAAAGSYVFKLDAGLTSVTVSSDQPWCTAKIEPEGICATFTQNDKNATRTAVLSITRNGQTPPVASVALIQSRAAISLADDRDVIQLHAAAEPVAVTVNCEVEWTAHSKADWLTLTSEEGKLVITPTQNPTGEVRKDRIILSVGEITKSFTVEQQGAVLTIEQPSVELYAAANNRMFDVAANVIWVADCKAEWLTVANVEGKLSLTPTANDGENRTTEVFLTAGTIKRVVRVSQRSLYESMLGSWTIAGQAIVMNEGVASLVSKSYKVTILEGVKNSSFLVEGFGTDYLATTTEAPFTLDFDPSKLTVSITLGEEIGTFVFNGFTSDPEGKAIVKSIFLKLIMNGGQAKVETSLEGGEVITGSISEDLNSISLETNKGMGFGMWVNSTKQWSGYFCSYRMFNISLTREIVLQSPAAFRSGNQFFYVER